MCFPTLTQTQIPTVSAKTIGMEEKTKLEPQGFCFIPDYENPKIQQRRKRRNGSIRRSPAVSATFNIKEH